MRNSKQNNQKMTKWVKQKSFKYRILPYLYKRELALIVPSYETETMQKRSVRMLKTHNIQGVDVIMHKLRIEEQNTVYNWYYSLAKYENGIPNQTLFMSKRNNTEWNNNHYKEIEQYDLLLDVDAGTQDFQTTRKCAVQLREELDIMNVPYYMRFSGRGFHFIVTGDHFPNDWSYNPKDHDNIYRVYRNIAKQLKETVCPLLDTGIYDPRRVCKMPFSLVFYKEKISMCKPIYTKKELEEFEDTSPDKIGWFPMSEEEQNPRGNVKKLMELHLKEELKKVENKNKE